MVSAGAIAGLIFLFTLGACRATSSPHTFSQSLPLSAPIIQHTSPIYCSTSTRPQVIQPVRTIRTPYHRLHRLLSADSPRPNTVTHLQLLTYSQCSSELHPRQARTVSEWTGTLEPICTRRHHGITMFDIYSKPERDGAFRVNPSGALGT
jgi:hypothetical protein